MAAKKKATKKSTVKSGKSAAKKSLPAKSSFAKSSPSKSKPVKKAIPVSKKAIKSRNTEVKKKVEVKIKAEVPAKATVKKNLPAANPKNDLAKKKMPLPSVSVSKSFERKDRPLNQEKIDEIRQAIITILWRKENIAAELLKKETIKEISFGSDQEFPRYFNHVIDVLTRYNLVEEVPEKRPQHLRLSQKLDA